VATTSLRRAKDRPFDEPFDRPRTQLRSLTCYERYSPFAYGSREWKLLYNKRVSVERVFSRLKTYRKLDAVRTRRLPKVWLHVALSELVMSAAALSSNGGLRQCVV
jgi:hypothetical protein